MESIYICLLNIFLFKCYNIINLMRYITVLPATEIRKLLRLCGPQFLFQLPQRCCANTNCNRVEKNTDDPKGFRLLSCPDCQSMEYCGPVCRQQHFSIHQHDCPLLQRNAELRAKCGMASFF